MKNQAEHSIKNTVVVIIFSISMAALESAVVVYLRALYYPGVFTVALKLIDEKIIMVEVLREAATLIMIGSVAYLTGKTRYNKFANFLLCFAVWDIFYYVWLKVFIDWPTSFFEWDILFLIPVTWLGPVLSPLICSTTMIFMAVALFRLKKDFKILGITKWLLCIGSLLILYTYMHDYIFLLLKNDLATGYFNLLKNQKFWSLASGYIPQHYNWSMFWLGELFIAGAIFSLLNTKSRVYT